MVAAGATAAAGGLAALGIAAVKTYADYEQLVGGSQLLFGEAYDFVAEKAKTAYKDVQMSQNEYLQQMNGFATGLKTSLGGNERAAAELASKIITAEADIVAATGNSQEAVQNAFNGIMKSNFTMLDNLQLGITPTKEGFQEVIDKVNEWNKANGEATAYQIGNLADCQAALVDYVKMQGLAGYAANEAAGTISGSIATMKAAWENLLVGVADDTQNFDVLVDNFVNSVAVFAQNIIPRVGTALQGALNLVIQLAPIIAQQLPGLIKSLAPQVLNAGLGIVTWLVEGIKTNVPVLLEKGYELLQNLVNGFVEAIPEKLPLVLDFVQQMGNSLAEKVPILIQKGFELISRLAEGMVSAFPILVQKVPTIISTFANIINDNFPTILAKGVEIIWQLIKGLISAIPTIIANIPQIISAIVDTIMAFQWLNLGKNIIEAFKKGIDAMKNLVANSATNIHNAIQNVFKNLPGMLSNFGKSAMHNLGSAISGLKSYITTNVLKITSAIESTLLQLPEKMLSIGGDIVKGLWNGISNMTGWITDKILGFASGIIKAAKEGFDEHSPSKEFEYIGEMCVAGYNKGVDKLAAPLYMTRKIKSGLTAMQNAVDTGTYAGGSAEGGNLYQTINVNREIATADEMARAIRLEARWGLVRSVPVG